MLRTQLDARFADTHDQGATPEDEGTVAGGHEGQRINRGNAAAEFGLDEHGALLRVSQQPAK